LNSSRIAHWVSMSDPKYLPMMALPMVVVYLAGGPPNYWLMAEGCFAVVVLNTSAVLVNMQSDRGADEVNFPQGARALDQYIGYHRLHFWISAFIGLLLLASAVIWFRVSHQVSIIYTLGWLIALNYSAGLRLKRSLVFSRLAICCGPAFAFAAGWALRNDLSKISRVVVLLFIGQGFHLLIKDLPDAVGDKRLGLKTLFTSMPRSQVKVILPLLWLVPYMLASVGAWMGWWPQRYQALWVLYPLGYLVLRAAFQSHTAEDRELTRELAQIYASLFVFANLFLFSPTPVVAWICGLSLVYYFCVLALRIDRRCQSHGLSSVIAFAVHTCRTDVFSSTNHTA
jgi:1,4-dihydroxy-2-naphthoate octaprenyltransferase